MNRREALLNGGAMVISASLGGLACATQNAVAEGATAPASPRATDGTLASLAFECQKNGEACADHCVKMLSSGDTSMAECLAAVREMLAATDALGRLSSMNSRHLVAAARLAALVCEACEAACRKHGSAHAVCHECAECCARTLAACRKLIG